MIPTALKILSITLPIMSLHILWHVKYIERNNGMKSGYKAWSVIVTWLILVAGLYLLFDLRLYFAFPFTLFVFWLIKDASLGWLLHNDICYLGTGKFDQYVSRLFQGGKVFTFFKIFCILFFMGLLKYL